MNIDIKAYTYTGLSESTGIEGCTNTNCSNPATHIALVMIENFPGAKGVTAGRVFMCDEHTKDFIVAALTKTEDTK